MWYAIPLIIIMSTNTKAKRKRNTQFEVLSSRSRSSTPGPSITPGARNVTYTRVNQDDHGNRTRESHDVSDIHVSSEDIAILQEHPEYSSTANNFLDFEAAVCSALDLQDSSAAQPLDEPQDEPQDKQRVRARLSVVLVR